MHVFPSFRIKNLCFTKTNWTECKLPLPLIITKHHMNFQLAFAVTLWLPKKAFIATNHSSLSFRSHQLTPKGFIYGVKNNFFLAHISGLVLCSHIYIHTYISFCIVWDFSFEIGGLHHCFPKILYLLYLTRFIHAVFLLYYLLS